MSLLFVLIPVMSLILPFVIVECIKEVRFNIKQNKINKECKK